MKRPIGVAFVAPVALAILGVILWQASGSSGNIEDAYLASVGEALNRYERKIRGCRSAGEFIGNCQRNGLLVLYSIWTREADDVPDRYSSEHTAMYVAIGDLVEMWLNSDRFTDQELSN